ncbi:hypothetical protein EDD86DRAFT_212796 [Gorgonomyces haynaldii]|nr:hypothetical protein EDD86DRAFT_212796 [Gorgonomyces haynaldii]
MKLLILGDGNFSFSLALCSEIEKYHDFLGSSGPWDVTCTSIDTLEELLEKYDDFALVKQKLDKIPFVRLMHRVNAWELEQLEEQFDLILWNHPHLGSEDFRLHRFLLAHFFDSCLKALTPNGKVQLALVQGQETRWQVMEQAEKSKLYLEKMAFFDESIWPGYHPKRNTRGQSFKNFKTVSNMRAPMRSCYYRFGPNGSKFEGNLPDLVQQMVQNSTRKVSHLANVPQSKLQKKVKKPDPPSLNCPHCDKLLSSTRGYYQHIHMVHELKQFGDWTPDRERQLECPDCDKCFADQRGLDQHITSKHQELDLKALGLEQNEHQIEGYEYVPCQVCGQAIVNTDWGREMHRQSLKPLVSLELRCIYCPDMFLDQRALLQHVKFCQKAT